VPAMSRTQVVFCQSPPWRAVARRIVLPWALQGVALGGRVLEIGAGSGAMAAEVLEAFPSVTVTATDVDDEMVGAIAARLASYGDRAMTRVADATALPFGDGTFDTVLSWVMLHHTVAWETALDEAMRVLRPGGRLVGYDLLSSPPLRLLHRRDHDRLRLMRLGELRDFVPSLPVGQSSVRPGLGGLVVRFQLTKRSDHTGGN
jgi:ubiquinone/menaquinone biosynthesis C-methylase UbiE